MTEQNLTELELNPLLSARWSPYAFNPERQVRQSDLEAVFEAARSAMSSYNEQPWRYIVGVRDHDRSTWQKVLDALVDDNQTWAQHAPVLAIGLVQHTFEENGQNNKAAIHDLGASSAFLTIEATARGLSVHQMIGIKPDQVRASFQIAESIEPYTALAIGYSAGGQFSDLVASVPKGLPDSIVNRDAARRGRKPLGELIIGGSLTAGD